MLIRIRIKDDAMDWVNKLKNPVHFGTPNLIIASETNKEIRRRTFNIPDYVSEYLATLVNQFGCNKMEIMAAIIEFWAFTGVTLEQAMQIVFYSDKIKENNNCLNVNREHVLGAVIFYHSKQILSAEDWHKIKNIATLKRGIKRKYKKI